MPIPVSISDLLGTAALAARMSAKYLEDIRAEDTGEEIADLRAAIECSVQALSESVAALQYVKAHGSTVLAERVYMSDQFERVCNTITLELMAQLEDRL